MIGGVDALNRPDGIVFGPDGNLYVASFRANASDADAIRIYDGHTGVFIKEIELSTPPAPRAFAQGLLFGPDGKLFVPISGNDATTTGRIRKYDVETGTFEVFAVVPTSTSPESSPESSTLWYLTFGKTNPGTLAYGNGNPGGGNNTPPPPP